MSSAMPVSITLIASHALNADELGRVSLVLWFMSIGALLGVSWAAWLLPQIARRPHPSSADGVVEGLGLASAGGGIAAGITLATGLRADLALPSAVGAAALGALRVLGAVFYARGAYLRLALSYGAGLAVALASLAIVLTVSATGGTLLGAYVWGLVTALGLAYLMSDAIEARRLSTGSLIPALRQWSLILILAALDAILWQRSELFFLHLFRSDREVGQYAAAYAVVATIWLPAAATAAVVVPSLTRAIRDRQEASLTYSQMWIAASIAFPPLLWVATLSAPLLIGRGGSELSPSPAALCAILAIGAGPAAAGVVASSAFYAAGLIGRMVVVGGVGALANVALDILLIPRYGMLGAAAATASVQLGVASVGFFLAGRELRVRAHVAALAAIALAAGVLGDLALLLMFVNRFEAGIGMLATAMLLIIVAGARFLQNARRNES